MGEVNEYKNGLVHAWSKIKELAGDRTEFVYLPSSARWNKISEADDDAFAYECGDALGWIRAAVVEPFCVRHPWNENSNRQLAPCQGVVVGNPGAKMMNTLGRHAAQAVNARTWDYWKVRYLNPHDGDGLHCTAPASLRETDYSCDQGLTLLLG